MMVRGKPGPSRGSLAEAWKTPQKMAERGERPVIVPVEPGSRRGGRLL